MKRVVLTVIVVLLTFSIAYAGQDVVNTKHNLGSTGTLSPYKTTGTDEVCVFCHTPHFALSTGAPLWNRTASNATYNMYNANYSATIDMTVASAPQGVSAACLSCHDGTVAFDSLINKPGSGIGAPTGWTWNANGNIMTATTSPSAMLGTDLTNDHPISVTYDITKDPAFKARTLVGNKYKMGPLSDDLGSNIYLPLYGASMDQVECGTCHDPHEKDRPTFLRAKNTASQVCTTCHIK